MSAEKGKNSGRVDGLTTTMAVAAPSHSSNGNGTTDAAAAPNGAKQLINLTSSANGASVLFATDEWFATAENLLSPAPPAFVPDLFCAQGKVMDGWETRRRRMAGHDWCVIKLGSGGSDDCTLDGDGGIVVDRSFDIGMVELDTAYFTGNQAPRVSIEVMRVIRTPYGGEDGESESDIIDDDNEDYLYEWMPGASTRLGRGGRGVRGTGKSHASVRRALEACKMVARRTLPNNPNGEWIELLPMTELQPGYEESRYHAFEITSDVKRRIEELGGVTHLRLNYYPDGGVARLKVHGSPCCHNVERRTNAASITRTTRGNESSTADAAIMPIIHPHSSPNPPPSTLAHPHMELSSEIHGGLGLACSNKHYGVPSNLLRPYPGKDMGDGWETARHPDRPAVVVQDPITGLQDTPLMDWSVVKLGCRGARADEGISRIIVDTRHFKGNFPESVTIDGCYADPDTVPDEEVCKSAGEDDDLRPNIPSSAGAVPEWFPLLKRTPLTADAEHEFSREHGHIVNGRRGVTHLRISITPDGGLSRVRIYGTPAGDSVDNVSRSRL